MNLTLTPTDLAFSGTLPPDVREEAEQWQNAFHPLTHPASRITHHLQQIARSMGVSYQTARRKYDTWRHNGRTIRALVNRSKIPAPDSALTPDFLNYIKALAEDNQRKTRPAWRKFCRAWKNGHQIPGLDNTLPRHTLPPGTGYDNVQRRIRDAFATTAMRRGLGAAIAKCGPQIFSNRAQLWYGSHIMIDDLWHDNFVVFQRQIVRVLELDALDCYSGCLLTFGCKPRTQRADGTFENLKERYARLLVTGLFYNQGYSPRGTTIMAEHGTAAISERVASILHKRTGGLITLRESGITGNEQSIVGWRGQGKGNPRFKASLESIRNLKHNELADALTVPAQTGKDPDHRPEYLHAQLRDCQDMLKAMAVIAQRNPDRARQLRLNLLDYHADFLPLLIDVYREINDRIWHNLQGWHEAGHIVIDYRTTPTADHWLTDAQFSQLPAPSKEILLTAAKADPSYIRQRKLSPAEVRARHQHNQLRLPAFVVGEILGDDYARELEVHGAYFNPFQDAEYCPEPLRYESVITTPDGQRRQLPDGKYLCFANPFDLATLFVHDARKVCLGTAPRVQRISPADDHQLKRAYGYRAKRIAELNRPILQRHADQVRQETNRLAHNARILNPQIPITQAEQLLATRVATEGPAAAQDILTPINSGNSAIGNSAIGHLPTDSAIGDSAIGDSPAEDFLSALTGPPPTADER